MNILIVHGWMEHPDFAWIPWLKKELEARGHHVAVPYLPNPDFPDRETWIGMIRDAIKDPETIIVAHSLGAPAVLLALQGYRGEALNRVILISAFARPFLIALQPWFIGASFDFELIKTKAKHWVFMHSEKDPIVPYEEGAWLASQMHEPLTTMPEGHATQEEGVVSLPEILEAMDVS
jgi:predicted alpha/beta hydrolase family esterase